MYDITNVVQRIECFEFKIESFNLKRYIGSVYFNNNKVLQSKLKSNLNVIVSETEIESFMN